MESSSGGITNGGSAPPQLPIFVQLNARHIQDGDQWREISRWVKFQEDVEDGGKRWSKPHVPSCSMSVMTKVREMLSNTPPILDLNAHNIHDIIEKILSQEENQDLDPEQKNKIQELFTQGVKQRMKMSFVTQMSRTSVVTFGTQSSRNDSLAEEPQPGTPTSDREGQGRSYKSEPSTPDPLKKGDPESGEVEVEESTSTSQPYRRHFSVTSNPSRRISRKMSYKDETMKYRDQNQFNKKVPKDAEAANIQVATCDFIDRSVFAFVRLSTPVILEDLAEINKPTRFFVLLLGPRSESSNFTEMGRAIGTLFTDQIFCGQSAYGAKSDLELLKGLDVYLQELTVLPPSAWNPDIRLDPPKSIIPIQSRLENRAQILSTMDNDLDEGDNDNNNTDFFIQQTDANHEDDDSLQFTGRLFGGLIQDVKRKIPWFVSDFKDALHFQTLASIIYIYLATVTKAITFGGFLGDITEGLQGVLESFLGHALAGGIFCLLGGQPLTVLGCTGPVLIFEKILVGFCNDYGIEYLTMRLWIGLWSALFCVIIVAFDVSAIVRYFTRFTEEAFAALVGIIFIVEALKKIFKVGKKFKVHRGLDPDLLTEDYCSCLKPELSQVILTDPRNKITHFLEETNITFSNVQGNVTLQAEDVDWNHLSIKECKMLNGVLEGHSCDYVPDIFFFSVILFAGTFIMCNTLKKFKLTPFFPAKLRKMISDYAVILTIIIFVLVDQYFNLATQKLLVPTVFKPTRSDLRGWLIPFFDKNSPWYIYLLASIPAMLLTILLFMDQQITSVIVNRKEHKLRKGAGYHLDMLIVGVMMGVCSVLGLPWCVAATVLCLGHVDSLKMDTESSAPGETPKFLGVREQRVTGIMVFILTGLSVKLAPILKFIPMPVLYGVLMYMGVNTLNGMQFVDRIFLLFMPSKHQPDYLYLRHVPLLKVHLFTAIQAGALAALWFIKSTQASLIFPLMVLALVGFRKVMDFFPSVFSQKDLYWIDNLMPASTKKDKKDKKEKKRRRKHGVLENGTEEEMKGLQENGDSK